MSEDRDQNQDQDQDQNRDLPPEAIRALAEAEERRRKAKTADMPKEFGGRDGPEPTRFGDYEKKGRAIDF